MRKKIEFCELSAPVLLLKAFLEDGKVKRYRRTSMEAFCRRISSLPLFIKCELCVNYGSGIENTGTYTNKKDLLMAYRCFTNADELRFIRKYWKNEPRPSDLYSKS